MPLSQLGKDTMNAEIKMMTQRSQQHQGSAKAVSKQIEMLKKQLDTHNKNAADTEAAIATMKTIAAS